MHAWMKVQVWNPEDAEDEVLAMVCRTGLNTQMGSMVRELVTPTTLSARKDTFVKVSNPRAASSHAASYSAESQTGCEQTLPASSNPRPASSVPRPASSIPRPASSIPRPASSNPRPPSSNALMPHNVMFHAVMLHDVLCLKCCAVSVL